MTFIPEIISTVSLNNVYNKTIGKNDVYTGIADDMLKYSSVTVDIISDQNSATDGISIQFGQDTHNWDSVTVYTYVANQKCSKTFTTSLRYFRIKYTNSNTVANLRINIVLNVSSSHKEIHFDKSIVDSTGKLLVVQPHTVMDITHTIGLNNIEVCQKITGNATATFNANTSTINMVVTAADGDSVIRRSRRYAIYQPGKTLLIQLTGILDADNNATTVTTSMGYNDTKNGYFFKYTNNILSVVERTYVTGSIVDTTIPQTSWNIDQMNGSGISGTTIDASKIQIYVMQLLWQGVGDVMMGIYRDGRINPCHVFKHANIGSTVYITNANLPIWFEISTTGGAGQLDMICSTVISEGGYEPVGIPFTQPSALSRSDGKVVSTNSIIPILSFRRQTDDDIGKYIAIVPKTITLIASTTGAMAYLIYLFRDKTDDSYLTDPVWKDTLGESHLQYDASATAIATTNGHLVQGGFFSKESPSATISMSGLTYGNSSLSTNLDGYSDYLSICVFRLQGQSETVFAAMSWNEVY